MATTDHLDQAKEGTGLVESYSFTIGSAVQVYMNAHGALLRSTGLLDNFTAATTKQYIGKIEPGGANQGATKGLGSSSNPKPKGIVRFRSYVLYQQAVTGASAATDAGSPVFLSDNNTYTLTYAANRPQVGTVLEWISSTLCNLYIFSFGERQALAGAGGSIQTVNLGYVDAAKVVDGNIIKYRNAARFRVLDIFAVALQGYTGSGHSHAITAKGGVIGTPVAFTTGGTITLDGTTQASVGLVASCAAITQDATTLIAPGDELVLTDDVSGTQTAGASNIYASILVLP